MIEGHHLVELFPGVGHLRLIAMFVGENLLLIGLLEPVLVVEHEIGVAVGLIAIEAALVIVAGAVKGIRLEILGLVLGGVLIEIDEDPRFGEIGNAEGSRQSEIE